jgi:DNA-binding NarL/FixJ family response regulator
MALESQIQIRNGGVVLPIRILLLGDQRLFRDAIASAISADPALQIIAQSPHPDDVAASVAEARPDVVVILDSFAQAVAAPALARSILRRQDDARIVVVSMLDGVDRADEALEAGVRGYVGKDQSSFEMIQAIRAVAMGGFYLARAPALADADDDLRNHRTADSPSTGVASLTAREREIFRLAVRGMSNEAVAHHLTISKRTVETHRGRVLRKLHAHSGVDLVLFAARHGLLESG